MTNETNNKHYLIIGLGLTGLSCARFCQARNLRFSLCDTRTELPGIESIRAEFPQADIHLGLPDASELQHYDELLVSPGISIATPQIREAAESGVTISGDVQLFSEYRQQPLIAITGSNGKSTVTTLVAELLNAAGVKAKACGNIGVPVLDLLTTDEHVEVFVAELSSFQLETTRNLRADVAGILNISPDHMDRYDGMADYERAKQRIFQGAKKVVVNGDDDHTLPALSISAESRRFLLNVPAAGEFGVVYDNGDIWLSYGNDRLMNAADLNISGMHNVANALAALAFIDAIGVDIRKTLASLATFTGLDHRCQKIGLIRGVDYVNDSKGTNEGSTVAAIEGLAPLTEGRLWLIAGGEGKGQSFKELAAACQGRVEKALLFGADARFIEDALADAVATEVFDTLDEALMVAAESACDGDTVLFSPACASFDQFRNYVHRGEYFRQCVEGLS